MLKRLSKHQVTCSFPHKYVPLVAVAPHSIPRAHVDHSRPVLAESPKQSSRDLVKP